MDRNDGCLFGLGKLFLVGWIFDWLQKTFGYKSGSCMGCGCGTILMIIFIIIVLNIIFGTDWFHLLQVIPPVGLV